MSGECFCVCDFVLYLHIRDEFAQGVKENFTIIYTATSNDIIHQININKGLVFF